MRSRLLLVAIGVAAGVALTLGAVWANGLRAHLESDGTTMSVGIDSTEPGSKVTVQVSGLCLRGGDTARITGIKPRDTYGNAVGTEPDITGFSLAPLLTMGHREKDLNDYLEKARDPLGMHRSKTLSTQCSSTEYGTDYRGLVVEFEAPADSSLPVAVDGFVIDYKIRGMSKSITVETGVSFCAEDDRDRVLAELMLDDGSSPNVYDCQL